MSGSTVEQSCGTSPGRPTAGELARRIKMRFQAADHMRRGACLLCAGKYDQAAAEFSAASALDVTDQSLPAYLAACYLGSGNVDRAANAWGQGPSPRSTTHRIRQALALHAAGRTESAIASLRAAIALDTENAELHFQLGALLADLERFDEAELRFTQALSIDRHHIDALINLALVYGSKGLPGPAVQFLQRAQVLRPQNPRIALLLAQAAKAAGESGVGTQVRAAVFDDAEEADPAGIEELARIVASDPDFVDALLSLPVGELDQRVFAMLARTLQAALERSPGHAELHHHCGRLLDRLGRREEAIAENERALEIDPTFARALIELGKLYQQTDRAQTAAARLEQAIRAGADFADVYFLLGNLYRDQGQFGRARTAYRKALELNHHYEAAQQALATLCA